MAMLNYQRVPTLGLMLSGHRVWIQFEHGSLGFSKPDN